MILGENIKALHLFKLGREIIVSLADDSDSKQWRDYLAAFDADIEALER